MWFHISLMWGRGIKVKKLKPSTCWSNNGIASLNLRQLKYNVYAAPFKTMKVNGDQAPKLTKINIVHVTCI